METEDRENRTCQQKNDRNHGKDIHRRNRPGKHLLRHANRKYVEMIETTAATNRQHIICGDFNAQLESGVEKIKATTE